jgi:hypothetical protein
MAADADDTSIRLEQAFREVSAQRAARGEFELASNGQPPVPIEHHPVGDTPGEMTQSRPSEGGEDVRLLVRDEVAAALAESNLAVEMGVLVAAVEHLKQRVDALMAELERAQSDDAAPSATTSRRALRHGLRSASSGRDRGQ